MSCCGKNPEGSLVRLGIELETDSVIIRDEDWEQTESSIRSEQEIVLRQRRVSTRTRSEEK